MTADGLSDYTLPFRDSLSSLLSLLECPKSYNMFDSEKHDGYLTPLKKKSFDWGHIGNPDEYDTTYLSLSLSPHANSSFLTLWVFQNGFFHSLRHMCKRSDFDVSREPCLGDLSTTALEAVKATKCSWIA